MHGVLKTIVDLCLLRGSPRDLPYSTSLLTGLLILSVGLSMFAGQLLGASDTILPRTLVWLLLHLGVIYLLLQMRSAPGRFVQTVSAFAGTGILVSLALLPLSRILYLGALDPEQLPNPLLSLLWIIIFAWSFFIDAHILRHALRISLSAGLLIAVLLFTARTLLDSALFATPGVS